MDEVVDEIGMQVQVDVGSGRNNASKHLGNPVLNARQTESSPIIAKSRSRPDSTSALEDATDGNRNRKVVDPLDGKVNIGVDASLVHRELPVQREGDVVDAELGQVGVLRASAWTLWSVHELRPLPS